MHTSRVNGGADARTPTASLPDSGTLFRLECVLLFALDVVRGPYIHSCAPANPPQAIRSLLQTPTAPTASSHACSAPATHAAQPFLVPSRRGAPSLPRPAAVARDSDGAPHSHASRDDTRAAGRAGDAVAAGALLSIAAVHGGAAAPSIGASSSSRSSSSSSSSCDIGDDRRSGDVAPSSTMRTPPPPPQAATATRTTSLTLSPPTASSSLLAGHPRLLEFSGPATPDDGRVHATLYRSAAVAVAASPAAPAPAAATATALTPPPPHHHHHHHDSDHSTAFGGDVSSQTCAGESQRTLPCSSPTAGSFAFAAMASTDGVGDATTMGTPRRGLDDGANSSSGGGGGGGGEVAYLQESSHHHSPRAGVAAQDASGGSPITGGLASTTTTTYIQRSDSSSPTATPVTPPHIAAAAARTASSEHGAADEERHRHLPQWLPPPSSHARSAVGVATPAAGRGGALPVPSATTTADDGRMSGYSDVFVPRSEFCRRVLWLYPAESGQLFLYYPEDIPGEHYQRKTLRYSLCLAFRVDHKRMTIGGGLLHQLVRPYSVVLTNIAEELREAELKYAYMSRGLRSHAPAAGWQMPTPTLASATTAHLAAVDGAAAAVLTSDAGEREEQGQQKHEHGDAASHGKLGVVPLSGPHQMHYTLVRRRSAGQTSGITGSAFASGTASTRPDTYHLALVEHASTAVAAVPEVGGAPAVSAQDAGGPRSRRLDNGSDVDHDEEEGRSPPQHQQQQQRAAAAAPSPAAVVEATTEHRSGTSTSLVATTATSGTSHTPLSRFGTPLSLPAGGVHAPLSAAPASAAATATGGGVHGDGIRTASPCFTDAEAADVTVTPPSSLPTRSRTVSHGAAGFGLASVPSTALGESTSSTIVSSSAVLPLAPYPYAPPAAGGGGGVGGVHQGGANAQPQGQHTVAATSPRGHGGHRHSPAAAPVPLSGMTTLNAFITPPTAPQWTPLSVLVAELFRCLSSDSDGSGDADLQREREGHPSASATAAGVGGGGGDVLAAACAGRSPVAASPTSAIQPQLQHHQQQQQQQQQRRHSPQSLYSPLTMAVGSTSGAPLWAFEGEAESDADGRGGSGAGYDAAAPPPLPPQQRGDTSVVHLSNRLSFHVRRMAPLQPARLLHYDHVPVPVVAYDQTMWEWMDMAVHHVFRLVDGVRTVADLVFDVAMGTTTTLAEVYADALRRSAAEPPPPPRSASAGASSSRGRGAAGGTSAPLSPAMVVSVPIDARPCSSLLPGVRYTVPTSTAAAAVAAAISDGQAPLPNHVHVHIAPGGSATEPLGTHGAAAASTSAATPPPPPPHIAVELPHTWAATTAIVMEALLHLELCHLVKLYRPWRQDTLYSTTRSLHAVLRSASHPARHVVARYLLGVAWTERQGRRAERRRRLAEEEEAEWQAQRTRAARAAASPKHQTPSLSPPLHDTTVSTAGAATARHAGSAGAAAAVTAQSPHPQHRHHLHHHHGNRGGSASLASPPLPSSVPAASDRHRSGHQRPLAHRPSSVPRPPPPLGGSAAAVTGAELSSTGTHMSCISTSVSATPSSLRHGLYTGASGRLQLTLVGAAAPPSPLMLVRPGVGGAASAASSHRMVVGSHGSQAGGGGLLPCASVGAGYGSSSVQRQTLPPQQQRQQQGMRSGQYSAGAAATRQACSSTSSSGSKGSYTSVSRTPSTSTLSSDSDSSSVSPSTASSTSVAGAASLPVPVSITRESAAPLLSDGDSQTVRTPSPSTSVGEAKEDAHIVRATTPHQQQQEQQRCPPSSLLGDGSGPEGQPRRTSTSAAPPSRVPGAASQRRESRRRRCPPPPLQLFAPTPADVGHAAAAALCALAKFSNTSVFSAQNEMRRIPAWATTFNSWSDCCMKALVEVAVLNHWLEEVSL
ncbi:hypothetical protein NESM_000492300 [Novymonas esmeraldas]|uniref:Uncharacterized protein n=1 Tax=Novymonas esmeraldas TaxID=1808958 RepID=A0AAW0ESJ1_9TRYP